MVRKVKAAGDVGHVFIEPGGSFYVGKCVLRVKVNDYGVRRNIDKVSKRIEVNATMRFKGPNNVCWDFY